MDVTLNSGAGNPTNVGPRAVAFAGTNKFTLTNVKTGTTVPVHTVGTAIVTTNPDGFQTITINGPSVVLLFPTDPGGPSTTLFQGQVVLHNSPLGVTTILSHIGPTVDLCAALGG